jgi:serine/threonine protein kinase, bacterial
MQLSGRLNNRYEVIRELGEGGFGTTFLVRDHQMPSGRQCVIKQLKPLHQNPPIAEMIQQRFQREAAILEKVGEHDQVPRLYAYFCEAENFYLVEEYIVGDTLTQTIEKLGIQSEAVVRSFLADLLPVIAHVHQQQLVHRDIKPDNIIIRASDLKPVLIDFGAVKETMGTIMTTQGHSARSIVVGTPGYMPAEQLAGRPIYASDLYSLGLTAIYLLTGKIPQELDTDPLTGAILWRSHARYVSNGFAALLDRMIQITPADRFSTALDLMTALNLLAVGITLPPHYVYPAIGHPADRVAGLPQDQRQLPSTVVSMSTGSMSTGSMSTGSMSTAAPIVTQGNRPKTGAWKQSVLIGGMVGLSIFGAAWLIKDQRNLTMPVENFLPLPQQTAPGIKPMAKRDATIVGNAGSKDIRSGPGMKYSAPHIAYPGDRVKVIASSRDEGGETWYQIVFPKSGAVGWIQSQLLNLDGVLNLDGDNANGQK